MVTYDPTKLRMNKRRAQENASQQDATRARSLLQNGSGPMGSQDAQDLLRAQSLTGGPSEALQAARNNFNVPPKEPVLAAPTGRIQEKERQRLRQAGFTDEQILEREQNLAPNIRDTMSNTGTGARFDKEGRVIPSSRNSRIDARNAEKEAELAGTKGYTRQTTRNKDGSVSESYVEDAGATANAREEARNRQANEDAANATAAEVTQENMQINRPMPPMSSFIDSLPPEYQGMAANLFGPLEQYMQEAQELADAGYESGVQAINSMDEQLDAYVTSARTRDDALFKAFSQMNEASLQNKMEVANQVRETSERELAYQEKKSSIEFERAERDQIIQNEQDRKAKLMGLGISGAWKATQKSASVISALKKGDRILADLRTDKALSAEFFGNKFLEVQSNYHSAVVKATDEYMASNYEFVNKMKERADELDSTVFNSQEAKRKAIVELQKDYLDGYMERAGQYQTNTLKAHEIIYDAVNEDKRSQAALAKEERDRMWDREKLQFNAEIELMKFGEQQAQRDEDQQYRLQSKYADDSNRVAQQISAKVEKNTIIKGAGTAKMYFNAIEAEVARSIKEHKGAKTFIDQTLIQAFNKMIDTNSVVREAEYDRSTAGAPLVQRLEGVIRKVPEGGELTPELRLELYKAAKSLYNGYNKQVSIEKQNIYLQLEGRNRYLPPEYRVSPEQAGLTTPMGGWQTTSLDSMLQQYQSGEPAPDPSRGGGGEAPASLLMSYGSGLSQNFNTKIGTNLYPESTVRAWGGTHKGLDIVMKQGTVLPAPVSGEVVEAGYLGGWGGTIVIRDSKGAEHRLAHLSELPQGIKPGVRIERGMPIAKSGGAKGTKGAGNSTGAHLDYRIKVNGQYIDPMKYYG